jgi:type VI secretion system secreted protein VgrG
MTDQHTTEGSITEDVDEALSAIEEIGTATQEGIESVESLVSGAGAGGGSAAGSEGGHGGGLGGAAAGGLGALGGATAGIGELAGAAGADPAVQRAIGIAGQALSTAGALVRPIEALVDGLREAIEGNHELRHVQYEFESAADPQAHWMVRQIEVTDSLGAPYLATVELVIEDLDAEPRELLGRDCRLTLVRASLGADICGIVHRVVHGRTTERAVVATVEIVPALRALDQRRDSRVFQEKTVVEILEDVLGNALEAYGREVDLGHLQRVYPVREHCVQYEESDLAFAHRLMEEEGITYYFEHHGNARKEKMILSDDVSQHPAVLTFDGATAIPFVAQRNEIRGTEPIHELARAEQLTSTSVVVADYDWTQADVVSFPVVAEQRSEDEQGREREIYEHDRALTFSEYQGSAYGANDATVQARLRHELARRDALVARGSGVVTGFAPGRTFELERHPRAELDGEYLITAVRHRGISAELRDLFGDASPHGTSHEYENTFECIPKATPYRPERITPKPRAHGVVTAIVVGPDGHEIYSDDYGRVKVQFHWDRLGVRNQDSSCFVRVMQAWAGPGRGIQAYPRVGDEVVVDFVGGDIDRPLVIGSVYSAANPPPYRAQADWTRTTIKSKTSPANGDRYNELRFDDL